MFKKIIAAILFPVFILCCNDEVEKSMPETEKFISTHKKTEQNDQLIYLDTAKNSYNILCQSWVMADDADALEGKSEDSKFDIPYRSLYFSTNGSFVKNPRNTFDYGNWDFDKANKTITLNNTIEKGKDIYTIVSIAADELILVNTGDKSSNQLKFIAQGLRLKNEMQEPFFIDNSRWRIKPKQKESESAIHQRLKENLNFFMLYYKSVLIKGEQTVSFWGLPSCFKWYGGGIFLKKESELKANWTSCFYNQEQAMQAYKIAERLLDQKYEWPKGEHNWIKQNLYVVEQMYEKIDEIR